MTEPERSDSIELPASTVWPMVVALGVTFGLTGLVTHVAVSVAGILLALVGGVGWPRRVERLAFGDERHRLRVPVEVQPLSAGIRGGLIGACVMAGCAAIYGILAQRSVWYPLNLLAAVAVPRLTDADVGTLRGFDGLAATVGLVAHGLTAVLVGTLYAAILPLLPRRHLLWGGLIAPLLWSGFLWAIMGVIDPTLSARISWTWFVASQIAFGLAVGYVVASATPVAIAQTRPWIERAGVEATGRGARGESPR